MKIIRSYCTFIFIYSNSKHISEFTLEQGFKFFFMPVMNVEHSFMRRGKQYWLELLFLSLSDKRREVYQDSRNLIYLSSRSTAETDLVCEHILTDNHKDL